MFEVLELTHYHDLFRNLVSLKSSLEDMSWEKFNEICVYVTSMLISQLLFLYDSMVHFMADWKDEVRVSGAVKFGDPLYPEECAVLLKNLSRCQVPFQCAHGRPALVPIVDLQHLHIQAKVSSLILIKFLGVLVHNKV